MLEGLADDVAVVPGIWPFEVSNGLVVAGRRGRLARAQVVRFARLLAGPPTEVEPADLAMVRAAVLPIAVTTGSPRLPRPPSMSP